MYILQTHFSPNTHTYYSYKLQILHPVDTKGESPPSFYNGLGAICITSFPRKDLWSYYQSMSSEFIRSWKGVRHPRSPNPKVGLPLVCLNLNLIKNHFNTCILTHTHKHASNIQHGIIHPKHIYLSIKQ